MAEIPVALFVSNCSRATFIFSSRGSSLSASQVGTALGGNVHMLTTSGVFSTVGWSSGWVTQIKLGVSTSVAAGRDVCVRVAFWAGMAESILSGLRLSPWCAALETGGEVVGEACCNCSKALWTCRLMAMVMSPVDCTVSAREGVALVQ